MEQHVHDRLDDWQANALSIMGRTILVKSILSSIYVYLLVNTIVASSYLKGLEYIFRNFL